MSSNNVSDSDLTVGEILGIALGSCLAVAAFVSAAILYFHTAGTTNHVGSLPDEFFEMNDIRFSETVRAQTGDSVGDVSGNTTITPSSPNSIRYIAKTLIDFMKIANRPFKDLYHFNGEDWKPSEDFCKETTAETVNTFISVIDSFKKYANQSDIKNSLPFNATEKAELETVVNTYKNYIDDHCRLNDNSYSSANPSSAVTIVDSLFAVINDNSAE